MCLTWHHALSICAVPGNCAAYSGNYLLTFETTCRYHLLLATDRLFRNVDNKLPPNATQFPRRAQISPTSWRKPEMKQWGCSSTRSQPRYWMEGNGQSHSLSACPPRKAGLDTLEKEQCKVPAGNRTSNLWPLFFHPQDKVIPLS
jgi:hypothetical protein